MESFSGDDQPTGRRKPVASRPGNNDEPGVVRRTVISKKCRSREYRLSPSHGCGTTRAERRMLMLKVPLRQEIDHDSKGQGTS